MNERAGTSGEDAFEPEAGPGAEPKSRARQALLKRLADVVCLPASRVNAFERSVVGDLLVEMLAMASPSERARVAHRLAPLSELPDSVLRLLLRDEPEVAAPLIEQCAALTEADLVDAVRDTGHAHHLMIARRRGIGEVVCKALIETREPEVVLGVLANPTARLTPSSVEIVVGLSQNEPRLCVPLLRRSELRPSGAYVMFWWCGPDERRTIVQRFGVSREVMQEVAEDVFAMAAAENWSDPLSRKALQFIERRQRNRAAIEKSPFDSLEHALATAAETGMSREIASEIAYLSGIKPLTGAKILSDPGGEPLAILCKATGCTRNDLLALWRGLRRREADEAGGIDPGLERVLITFEMLAVDRAQTILRYWNWSLSSAITAELMRAIREGDEDSLSEYSMPEKTAMLALRADLRR